LKLSKKRFGEVGRLAVGGFELNPTRPKIGSEFTLEEFDVFKNGSKPDILRCFDPPVANLFVKYMDHKVRNGIGYYSAKYDVVSGRYSFENDRGSTTNSVPYVSFCHSMFELYLQLEAVSLYVNWLRLLSSKGWCHLTSLNL